MKHFLTLLFLASLLAARGSTAAAQTTVPVFTHPPNVQFRVQFTALDQSDVVVKWGCINTAKVNQPISTFSYAQLQKGAELPSSPGFFNFTTPYIPGMAAGTYGCVITLANAATAGLPDVQSDPVQLNITSTPGSTVPPAKAVITGIIK